MNILYYGIISMCVSFYIGIMLNSNSKISLLGALTGGICYSVFMLCGASKVGYFAGGLLLALFSELLAKMFKTPSTSFLIIGVYPLVPGSGVYKTIMLVIEANYAQALKTGGDTFISIALISTAIALVAIMFGKVSEERFKNIRSFDISERNGVSNGKSIY